MDVKIFFIATTLYFAQTIMLPTLLMAEATKAVTGMEWEQYLEDSEFSYQSKATAAAPDGKALLVAGTYFKGRRQGNVEGIWIWKIDVSGKKIADIKIKQDKATDLKIVGIEAIEMADNNIVLVGLMDTKQSVLVKLNERGKIVLSKKLGNGRHVSKIVRTMDGKFLLIGHEFDNGFIAKIDSTGEELWHRIVDRGQQELFVDGLPTADNGILLLENSGKREQFFMGSSVVWLSKYSADGKKLYEKSFVGRSGSIAKSGNDGYVVLYDRGFTAAQDIWAQAVNENLETAWSAEIVTTKFGLEKFKAIGLAQGGYIIVGSVNLRPWVSYLNLEGRKKWTFEGGATDVAVGHDLISNGTDCFLVSSVVVGDKTKPGFKVRVIKFKPSIN